AAAYTWYTWPAPIADTPIPPVSGGSRAPAERTPMDIPQAQERLKLKREQHGTAHADVAEALMLMADLYRDAERMAEGPGAYQEALAIRNELNGPDHWQARAARAALDDLDRWARLGGPQRQQLRTARAAYRQSLELYRHGKYREAIDRCANARNLFSQTLGE